MVDSTYSNPSRHIRCLERDSLQGSFTRSISDEARIKYNDLCMRGFLAQVIMSLTEANLHEVFKIIASVVMIRGDTFELSSIFINRVFGTLNVDHDDVWELESLDLAVAYLTVLSHKHAIRTLVGDEELIGRPMYWWRIKEASVPRDVSPQQVMYHNID
ncbi:hypothetical protein Bca4012_083960 [Brassica carinata]